MKSEAEPFLMSVPWLQLFATNNSGPAVIATRGRGALRTAAVCLVVFLGFTGCSSESASRFSAASAGPPCASGGVCAVMDRGPGGGWMIKVGGPGENIEVAPRGWGATAEEIDKGTDSEPRMLYKEAVKKVTVYVGGGKNDWRLPNIVELRDIYKCTFRDSIGGFNNSYEYFSSTLSNQDQKPHVLDFGRGVELLWRLVDKAGVRPIRRF